MNAIDYLAAAATFAVGYFTARFTYRQPVRTIHGDTCQCSHVSSTHDAQGCHAQVKRASRWERGSGYPVGYEWVDCACVRFVGPSSSYVPELDALPEKEIKP